MARKEFGDKSQLWNRVLYPHPRFEVLGLIQTPCAVLHVLPAAAHRDAVVTGDIKPGRGCPVTVVLYTTTMKLPDTGQLRGCMDIDEHEC